MSMNKYNLTMCTFRCAKFPKSLYDVLSLYILLSKVPLLFTISDATDMVMHKDSKFYETWQNFKDNNQFVTSEYKFTKHLHFSYVINVLNIFIECHTVVYVCIEVIYLMMVSLQKCLI